MSNIEYQQIIFTEWIFLGSQVLIVIKMYLRQKKMVNYPRNWVKVVDRAYFGA